MAATTSCVSHGAARLWAASGGFVRATPSLSPLAPVPRRTFLAHASPSMWAHSPSVVSSASTSLKAGLSMALASRLASTFKPPLSSLPVRCLSTEVTEPSPPAAATTHAPHSITYINEHPFLALPSHEDPSVVTLFRIHANKPISHLLTAIQEEDPTTTSLHIQEDMSKESPRWARSTMARDVLDVALSRGLLVLNVNGENVKLSVTPFAERVAPINQRINATKAELAPLSAKKLKLDRTAHRRGVVTNWIGLAALCAQWGIMARLTWWEYSWDVMEPISYILSVGTAIIAYSFYIVTHREYSYENIHEVTMTSAQAKLYRRHKFDIDGYARLTRQLDALEKKKDAVAISYGLNPSDV
ncbi:hypothetical protein DFJ73DRAFT_821075 [Zopfochytrium polystomum]|nr:hypothetical protein DFJ73DRAFT_821075 [Zopfochytrium polystomum]